jgi:hypothetical protein
MSQKSGVTSSSAGTPKLSMKTEAPRAPEPSAAAPFDNPFDISEAVHQADDDPFAAVTVAVAEPESETAVEIDDPFAYGAAQIHDADAERAELEELLANARAVVASLETALERARENERMLALRVR